MGKVVFVGSSIYANIPPVPHLSNYQIPIVQNYYGGTPSSATGAPSSAATVHNHGGATSLSFNLQSIPMVSAQEIANDPLADILQYYHHNYRFDDYTFSKRKRQRRASVLATQIWREDLPHIFWDNLDIEEKVLTWDGDLLIQAGNERWSFCETDGRDSPLLQAMLKSKKDHKFSTHSLLRSKIVEWLDENVSEYDIFPKNPGPDAHDVLYIRDHAEAIHFKMRWTGEEPPEPDEEFPF